MLNSKIKILFIGDIFSEPGILTVEKILPSLIERHKIDFVIAQGENVSGRKGFVETDYQRLRKVGINAFTLGNHVWSKTEILQIINNDDVIRPFNIDRSYAGEGTRVFVKNDLSIRITSLMGITFNSLLPPWGEEKASSFFEYMDNLLEYDSNVDFHFVDFHAETTSEKNVLSLYLDGKIDAICGTHTHVQTNDARILPNGTAYITDAGMTGPINCAIGANYEEVYQKMRYGAKLKFKAGEGDTQFNGVILTLNKDKKKNKIKPVNIYPIKI